MARRAKCTQRTIRFYEQQGLVAATRTGGRHRRYSADEFERLRLVIELRRSGLSLDEIRSMIDVKRRHVTGAAASLELGRLLELQIEAIGTRVTELLRHKQELEQLRGALEACKNCHGNPLFPDSCAECASFAEAASGTSLWRALWNPTS